MRAARCRILAVASEHRLDALPDIPTLIELGVPGFLSDTWNAISAPPKTAAAIVAKLNRTINEILEEPETKARFKRAASPARRRQPRPIWRRSSKEETERWER